jgi:hypothetical protein
MTTGFSLDAEAAIEAGLARVARELAAVAETLKRLETLLAFIASAANARPHEAGNGPA